MGKRFGVVVSPLILSGVVAGLFVFGCSLNLDGFSGGGGADGSSPNTSSDGAVATTDGSTPNVEGGGSADSNPGNAEVPTFVQATGQALNTGSGSVILKNVGAHHAIVCALVNDSSGSIVITDGSSATFTAVVGPTPNSGSHTSIMAAFDLTAGDKALAVSIMGGTPPSYMDVYVAEYAGIGHFDVGATDKGVSGGVDGASVAITSTQPNELLFAFGFSGGQIVAGTGFNSRSMFGGNVIEDLVLANAGETKANATMKTGGGWQLIAAIFKP